MTNPRFQGRKLAGAPLSLASFAARGSADTLTAVLRRLGYPVSLQQTADGIDMEAADSARAMVLLVATADPAAKRAAARVPARAQTPVFGVFGGHDSSWRSLAPHCADFVCWPCDERELHLRLERLLSPAPAPPGDQAKLRRWVAELNLIGQSQRFLASCRRLRRIATCDAPVLIEGETGTGKDVAARAIHYQSSRADRPFVPVNCGALPDALIENELFGHEAGAYTGARAGRDGLVAQAEGGTLFLDEVEALTVHGQTSLLRFLEEQAYRPLGASRLRTCDVRIIAASNAGLAKLADSGNFRPDLFYRLNILNVRLPPLRNRCEDIRLLAEHFVTRYGRQYGSEKLLHPASLAWMSHYSWPGNVRELESLIHREFLLADAPVLRIDRPDSLADCEPFPASIDCDDAYLDMDFAEAKAQLIVDFEKRYLASMMNQTGGNVTLAARRAGKERRAFGKLIKKHGIHREDFS